MIESLDSQSTLPTIAEIPEDQSYHQVPKSSRDLLLAFDSLVAFAAAAVVAVVAGGHWRRRLQAANNKVLATEMTTSSPTFAVAALASKESFDPVSVTKDCGMSKRVESIRHGRHALLAALSPQNLCEAQSVSKQTRRAGEVLVAVAAGFAGARLGAPALLTGCGAARAASAGRQSSVARRAVGIGINGFGRIGRQVARIAMKDPEVELKLINASYDATIEADGDSLVIDGKKVALSHTRDPAEIPFKEHGAEYVCESTGVFLTTEKVQPHLKAGAKKVVFSAPA